ncbi:MAG: hypothetical protein QOI78_6879 [Actinomycetota bacterium]|nr:hypothetical protein [Actinomycetota bacterium]
MRLAAGGEGPENLAGCGRDAGPRRRPNSRPSEVPLRDAFLGFRDLVSADIEWIDSQKRRFKRPGCGLRVATPVLTGLSTIVLGIPEIPARASIALPLVAMVTLPAGLETYAEQQDLWPT